MRGYTGHAGGGPAAVYIAIELHMRMISVLHISTKVGESRVLMLLGNECSCTLTMYNSTD